MERAAAGKGLCCNSGFDNTRIAEAVNAYNDSIENSTLDVRMNQNWVDGKPDFSQITNLSDYAILDDDKKPKFDSCTNLLMGRAEELEKNRTLLSFLKTVLAEGDLPVSRMSDAEVKVGKDILSHYRTYGHICECDPPLPHHHPIGWLGHFGQIRWIGIRALTALMWLSGHWGIRACWGILGGLVEIGIRELTSPTWFLDPLCMLVGTFWVV